MAAQVRVYTTTFCPYCIRAKQLLDKKKAAYEEVHVDDRPDIRAWLVTASGQRTVPQIFINGASVGGFSELSNLDKQGKLDGMLAASPPSDLAELPG